MCLMALLDYAHYFESFCQMNLSIYMHFLATGQKKKNPNWNTFFVLTRPAVSLTNEIDSN